MRFIVGLFCAVTCSSMIEELLPINTTSIPDDGDVRAWRQRKSERRWHMVNYETFGYPLLTEIFSNASYGIESPLTEIEVSVFNSLCGSPTASLMWLLESINEPHCVSLLARSSPDSIRAIMCGFGTSATCTTVLPPTTITRPGHDGRPVNTDQESLARATGLAYAELYMERVRRVVEDVMSGSPAFFSAAELEGLVTVSDAFPLVDRIREAVHRHEATCTLLTYIAVDYL